MFLKSVTIFSLLLVIFTFQNCDGLGTFVGNPVRFEKIKVKLSDFNAKIESSTACLTNIVFQKKNEDPLVSLALTASSLSDLLNGYSNSYIYPSLDTSRLYVNVQYNKNLVVLKSTGTEIGEFSLPEGEYDKINLEFSSCSDVSGAPLEDYEPSLTIAKSGSIFKDETQGFFTIPFNVSANVGVDEDVVLNIDEFMAEVEKSTSSSNLAERLRAFESHKDIRFLSSDIPRRNQSVVNKVIEHYNGKTLMVGTTNNGGVVQMLIARYDQDGSLDKSFGSGRPLIGMTYFNTEADSYGAKSATISNDANKSIFVIGETSVSNKEECGGNSSMDIYVLKLSNLGGVEKQITWGGCNRERGHDIITLNNGGLLALGYNQGTKDLILLKLDSDLNLDLSFGANGVVTLDASAYSFNNKFLLKADSQENIFIAYERAVSVSSDWEILKLSSSGALIDSFTTRVHFGSNDQSSFSEVNDMLLASDGRTLTLVGSTSAPGQMKRLAVARILSTGGLDNSFSLDGKHEILAPCEAEGKSIGVNSNGYILSGSIRCPEAGGYYQYALDLEGADAKIFAGSPIRVFASTPEAKGGYSLSLSNGFHVIGGSANNAYQFLSVEN